MEKYNNTDLLERIKKTIKEKNTTQKKILINCDLSPNLFVTMKTSMPKSDNLAKIADELDVSVDYLLGRTDNQESHKQ